MHYSHKTSTHCPDCSLGPFAKNYLFNGKLITLRDFIDEQRFHIDKLSHHHQRLHGWGVVCGLKVKQHPDPVCRDRYVLVEPGTAVDCCGHQILVREEVRFAFAQAPAVQALNDAEPHALQICIRYKECPTEEIPVLFDECGCDETRCAPNRILESYEFDVLVDSTETAEDPHSVTFERHCTIQFAGSRLLALHDGNPGSLYVINTTLSGDKLHRLTTGYYPEVDSHDLPSNALAVAVSNDGSRVYLALGATQSDPLQGRVLDAENLGHTIRRLTAPPDTADSAVFLAVAPSADDRLFALFSSTSGSKIGVWEASINDSGPDVAPANVINKLPGTLTNLVFSSDGTRAYSAHGASSKIVVVDATEAKYDGKDDIPIADPKKTSKPSPSSVAVAHSSAGDMLVVGDDTSSKLYFVPLSDPNPVVSHVVKLTHHPTSLVASPGANWIYVLERDGATTEHFFVEAVNVQRVLLNLSDPLGMLVPVGEKARQLLLSESGQTLYVAYEGDSEDLGGVAILDVLGQNCIELLWKTLEGCPSCETGNCVVLATIEGYHVDDKLSDPPADSVNDAKNPIVRIDNRTGRTLLPSTQVLTEVIKCLLEHAGTTGGKGEQGLPGVSGTSVKSADAEAVPSIDDVDAQFDPGTGNIHFKIPQGEKGDSGTGLNFDLPHIVAINWPHTGTLNLKNTSITEILIAFDNKMQPDTINDKTLEVLRLTEQEQNGTECYCRLAGTVTTWHLEDDALPTCQTDFQATKLIDGGSATGARFKLSDGLSFGTGTYRVVVKGDFILGAEKIKLAKGNMGYPALDANHLGPGLLMDQGNARCPTGDGVEGGTFESWFSIK